MNKTKQILKNVKEAIISNRLDISTDLLTDICECYKVEMGLVSVLYTEERRSQIEDDINLLCTRLAQNEHNKSSIIDALDSMVLSIDLTTDLMGWFVNENYWNMKYHNVNNSEINEIINYINKHGNLSAISNNYVDEYDNFDAEVFHDYEKGLKYILFQNKKMYFPRYYSEDQIKEYYKGITIEQDPRSPHYYKKENYNVLPGDVVVDAGVAEGNFSLDIIDIAEHIYIIEADEMWVEALECTFEAYNEKITIIKGYLSNEMVGEYVSLDGLFADKEINYLKMDIEGYERFALKGAEKTIAKATDFRCAVCSYHKKDDEKCINEFFDRMNMDYETSNGYMVPVWDRGAYVDAEVRRGVVFGKKRLL